MDMMEPFHLVLGALAEELVKYEVPITPLG